jgi:multiple sugar transport system ATP-binding protein
VAGFMGSPSMNLFTVPVKDGGVWIGDQLIPVPREALATAGREVIIGIRPEHVEIAAAGGLELEIDVVEELGSEAFVFGRSIINGQTENLVARVDWRNPPEKGQVVHVRIDDAHAHLFGTDAAGERLAA